MAPAALEEAITVPASRARYWDAVARGWRRPGLLGRFLPARHVNASFGSLPR